MKKHHFLMLAVGLAAGYFAAPNLVALPVVGSAFTKAAELGAGS